MPKLRELHIGRVDKNACEAASSLNFLYCDTFELIGRREEKDEGNAKECPRWRGWSSGTTRSST